MNRPQSWTGDSTLRSVRPTAATLATPTAPAMHPDSPLPVPDPSVIYKAVSDGGVLLHTGTEVYFGLNQIGARIWELLPPTSRTLGELCSRIEKEHPDEEPATIRTDACALLGELMSQDLVSRPRPRPGPSG